MSELTDYWPPEHLIGKSPFAEVVFEPRVGGRWVERAVDGTECDWGRVVGWEPPNRVVLLWQITAEWKFEAQRDSGLHDADGTRRARGVRRSA